MTITKTYTKAQIDKLYQALTTKGEIRKTPPYAVFQIKMSDCMITAYESGKVVFQGDGAAFYAGEDDKEVTSKPSNTQRFPQSGSDEVGTGDYFGPVVVCASHVTERDIPRLHKLGVQDSKKMKDDEIVKVAKQLITFIPHSHLILTNERYNHVHKTFNMNAIKAKMHNKAFLNLANKGIDLSQVYVDQFTPPKSYFRYLQGEPAIIKDIHFETKAEDKYLSVACASIIARYYFLDTMDKMSAHYNFEFPKGAGKKVDEAICEFVKQHGQESLNQVAKVHFSNTTKALSI
ncbi:hypothetical protein A4S06_09220 [Erysipelotrichaceae bacterium MTC7]|nr:hypothetical protein A4S06_09220 [Erysipelotrichaceae bacterium MTC7]